MPLHCNTPLTPMTVRPCGERLQGAVFATAGSLPASCAKSSLFGLQTIQSAVVSVTPTVDLEDTRCPARLATRPLFSAYSALLSWKPRLAAIRLSQAACALGCWLVPATGSAFSTTDVSTASSLHAAAGSHGLADYGALSAYAALCVCLVWLAHWHGERRYIAGKADYHAQLASMATGKAVSK